MVAPDQNADDARADPQVTPSPGDALEPWTTPTVRVLAVSVTEGGIPDGDPEGDFYAPLS